MQFKAAHIFSCITFAKEIKVPRKAQVEKMSYPI